MRSAWSLRCVLLLTVALVLAGCARPDAGVTEGGRPVEDLPRSAVVDEPGPSGTGASGNDGQGGAHASPGGAGDSGASGLATVSPGKMVAWTGTCPCPAYRFALAEAHSGWLDVRVQWDGSDVADLGLAVDGPGGRVAQGERGFDDRLARVWSPAAGDSTVTITGAGAFTATARLGSLAIPAEGPLLPNLVEQVIEGPAVGPCNEVERTEQGAVTCMRFGNGVGNPGHGPVQIRLSMQEGALALLPMDGRFIQEVRQADGSVEGHEVGPAAFHPSHGHWHYDGFALFELYHVDPATGLRGDLAVSHHKSGFCFLDWDEMPENVTTPAEQERAETDCLVPGMSAVFSAEAPAGPPAWTNGISRGWYDFYEPHLTDQYVDIAGLPAGTYELVATADPAGTLAETDETDNQSSLLLTIDGERIEVLEERAHYRVQSDDDH